MLVLGLGCVFGVTKYNGITYKIFLLDDINEKEAADISLGLEELFIF